MTLDELIAALQVLRTDDEAGRMVVTREHPDSGHETEVGAPEVVEPDTNEPWKDRWPYCLRRVLIRPDY
jgi:hypothetical protein